MPQGLVVIVNWRAAELVLNSLSALVPELRALGGWRVIVVDNFSMDGSAERIEDQIAAQNWLEWVTVMRSDENDGFASGNNRAISHALRQGFDFQYVLLLNPDTEIRPGAVRYLLDMAADRPEIGVLGARSEDPDGTPQNCCFSFPNILSEFSNGLRLGLLDKALAPFLRDFANPERSIKVDWVSGAAMLIRREVLDLIGGLDRGYFLYFEETDFIFRARLHGFECWHMPDSRVVHLVGQSSGISSRDARPPRRPAYWFQSRRRYFVLNHGVVYAVLTDLVFILGYTVWRARRIFQRKPDVDPPFFGRDFLKHSALLNGATGIGSRDTAL